MLVVLEKLNPSERLAFVLHDMFGFPFEEIAPVLERSVPATRQLASRARRRVRGADTEAACASRVNRRAPPTATPIDVTGRDAVARRVIARTALRSRHLAQPAIVDGNAGLFVDRPGAGPVDRQVHVRGRCGRWTSTSQT